MNHPAAAQLTEPLPLPDIDQVRAEKAKRSLRDFVKYSWQIINPKTVYVESWHTDAMCDHLEAVVRAEIQNLIINVAPRSTKSTIVAIDLPAWWWIHEPEFCWLYSSYSQRRAIADSVTCRRIIESAWYRYHWGDKYFLTSDQNEKSRFENSHMGKRIAVSLHGAGTGEGGDAVICDDPHNIRDQYSESKLEAVINDWDQVMSQRVNDPKQTRKVIVMQRISGRDLTGHLLAQGGYELLMLPTEYDPKRISTTSIGWKDPRKKHGELLCPRRAGPTEVAQAKRSLGEHGYNAQHQQNPSPDEGNIFKRTHWRFYKDEPHDIVKKMDEVIQSWDFAFKGLDTSSEVAGHVWGRSGADMVLLDRETRHMDFNQSLSALLKMTVRWPEARGKIIEAQANGPAIMSVLMRRVPGLIPWPPKGQGMDSKVARARAMQPDHESGNIWLPDPATAIWVPDYIERCAAFPEGEYDDDVDAMTQAWQRLMSKLVLAPAAPEGMGVSIASPWVASPDAEDDD